MSGFGGRLAEGAMLRNETPLAWVVVVYLLSVAVVNPVRETCTDDDFGFAWSVAHLRATGEYRLHDWLAPNPPVWIGLGALVEVNGAEFTSLRLLTVGFGLLAVVGAYAVGREYGLSPRAAGLVSLALASSRLFILFTCAFLTDVPFIACLIWAIVLYSRGIRVRSHRLVAAGSVFGVVAVLTRQVPALLPALVVCWLCERERRQLASYYLVGILPLIVATGVQVVMTSAVGSFETKLLETSQLAYVRQPEAVAINAVWRIPVALQYLVLFCPALPLLLACAGVRHVRACQSAPNRKGMRLAFVALLASAVWMAWAVAYGMIAMGKGWTMPYLPWYFDFVPYQVFWVIVTPITMIGGVVLGAVLMAEAPSLLKRNAMTAGRPVMALTALFLFAQTLVYYRTGDKYYWPLLPLIMVPVMRSIGDGPRWVFVTCVSVLLVQAAVFSWLTRQQQAATEAQWQCAEYARRLGVPVSDISGPWEWMGYYRYNECLDSAATAGRLPIGYFFREFLPGCEARARYRVVTGDGTEGTTGGGKVLYRSTVYGLTSDSTFSLLERP